MAALSSDLEDEESEDPDAEIEPPKRPLTMLGDIWIMGCHRLICGDSTSAETVKALMANDLADLLITDPPYNVDMSVKERMI